jgi:hypothetical protein
MSSTQIQRASSFVVCESLGLPTNRSLPELESSLSLRSKTEIVNRALTLNVVVACSYGFPKKSGLAWLQQHNLSRELTASESEFLNNERANSQPFKLQAECIFAFAWVFGLVGSFNWKATPPNNLVLLFPNLKEQESPQRFVAESNLRNERAILSALDAAFCIHWACRELELSKQTPSVSLNAVTHRRWVFEWVMSDKAWDEISLDT